MNKEFEEWYENYCPGEDGRFVTQQDIENGFEAGQQSERNKHRWIPVTERLPTVGDGKIWDGNTILILITDGNISDIASFSLDEKKIITRFGSYVDSDRIISWQPLPEA